MSGHRLKVLVLAGWYPNEDSPLMGVFIQDQARALDSQCEVSLLYVHIGQHRRRPTVSYEAGVMVVRCWVQTPVSGPGRIRNLRILLSRTLLYGLAVLRGYALVRRRWGRPEIIHAHILELGGFGAWVLSKATRLPYVITEHAAGFVPEDGGFWRDAGRIVRWLSRAAARRAVAVIAVSTFQAHAMRDAGISAAFLVVPNVVRPLGPVEPLPGGPCKHICHVSLMLDRSKDISGLLAAVSLLLGTRADFHLDLVGDGPDRERLEARASELRVSDHVTFHGRVAPSDLGGFYSRAAFSVVSSRYETFCVAAAEALSCGRPVVSTRCGGPEDFVRTEVGLLVDRESPQALARGMDWMLDHYAGYDAALVAQYAERRFSSAAVTGHLLALYSAMSGVASS